MPRRSAATVLVTGRRRSNNVHRYKVITFDLSLWPVLVTSFSGEQSDKDFIGYLARYEELIERGERYGIVLVTEPKSPMMRPAHAKMQAEWIREREQIIRERCAGIAFVLPSAIMRGALKAILWMQPMPCRHAVFSLVNDGVEWVSARLREEGLIAGSRRKIG
jgi:hypothetical protein